MPITSIPASQGSVVVSSGLITAVLTVPDEALGDEVELLEANTEQVLALGVKTAGVWRATFTIQPGVQRVDLTARVKRRSLYSPLTMPVFTVYYPTNSLTSTPTVTITPTPTVTQTTTPSPTVTISPTPSVTVTPTLTITVTAPPTSAPTVVTTVVSADLLVDEYIAPPVSSDIVISGIYEVQVV